MKIEAITKREAELIRLYGEAKEASTMFSETCKFVAQQAETTPKVVRIYITALASEKANVLANETAQLVILFDSMPTVTGEVG